MGTIGRFCRFVLCLKHRRNALMSLFGFGNAWFERQTQLNQGFQLFPMGFGNACFERQTQYPWVNLRSFTAPDPRILATQWCQWCQSGAGSAGFLSPPPICAILMDKRGPQEVTTLHFSASKHGESLPLPHTDSSRQLQDKDQTELVCHGQLSARRSARSIAKRRMGSTGP